MSDDAKKTCFIIMPITTPDAMLEVYQDGEEHFKHVLDCLFIPSIKKSGYDAIPPIARGADLIHAEIVKNLETADLVLCDISCLNPNVFFEYGIRTSLNKPVCVVKDELIKKEKVPFDTGVINYEEYSSSLHSWHLNSEITKLAQHLTDSAERSQGQNMLWKYFGLRSESKPYEGKGEVEAKVDMLALQVESISRKLDDHHTPGDLFTPDDVGRDRCERAMAFAHKILEGHMGLTPQFALRPPNKIMIMTEKKVGGSVEAELREQIWEGFHVEIDFVPSPPRLKHPRAG